MIMDQYFIDIEMPEEFQPNEKYTDADADKVFWFYILCGIMAVIFCLFLFDKHMSVDEEEKAIEKYYEANEDERKLRDE